MDNHHHHHHCRVLVDWFTAQGGTFDRELLTFAPIDSLGWSALALRDLQVPKKRYRVHQATDN
jgi:hypothetical protein